MAIINWSVEAGSSELQQKIIEQKASWFNTQNLTQNTSRTTFHTHYSLKSPFFNHVQLRAMSSRFHMYQIMSKQTPALAQMLNRKTKDKQNTLVYIFKHRYNYMAEVWWCCVCQTRMIIFAIAQCASCGGLCRL